MAGWFACQFQAAALSFWRVSGGQRISPEWKRPTGWCTQTVARSLSISMILPRSPRYEGRPSTRECR
jgi:hypothetical protein